DLAQLAAYHTALRRREERPAEDARFALAGLCSNSLGVRARLSSVLGPRLVEGPIADAVVAPPAKTGLAAAPAALAGAVGAALEALRPAEERVVLRHLPADLPPYREKSPLLWVAA